MWLAEIEIKEKQRSEKNEVGTEFSSKNNQNKQTHHTPPPNSPENVGVAGKKEERRRRREEGVTDLMMMTVKGKRETAPPTAMISAGKLAGFAKKTKRVCWV